MAEGNLLFQPVKNYCRHTVATCAPDDTVLRVAEVMREQNISSLVVCDEQQPIGILTDRDLRNKVVAEGADPSQLTASDIMNAPLITVNEDDFIFEALHIISRNNIHRVCVIDKEKRLTGIITDSDILRMQTHSPQRLVRDIEEAETINELLEEKNKMEQRIKKIGVEIEKTRERIGEEYVEEYDRLRKRTGGGIAVAAIRGDECTGCGMQLTSRTQQHARRGAVVNCPTCGRIVVYKPAK